MEVLETQSKLDKQEKKCYNETGIYLKGTGVYPVFVCFKGIFINLKAMTTMRMRQIILPLTKIKRKIRRELKHLGYEFNSVSREIKKEKKQAVSYLRQQEKKWENFDVEKKVFGERVVLLVSLIFLSSLWALNHLEWTKIETVTYYPSNPYSNIRMYDSNFKNLFRPVAILGVVEDMQKDIKENVDKKLDVNANKALPISNAILPSIEEKCENGKNDQQCVENCQNEEMQPPKIIYKPVVPKRNVAPKIRAKLPASFKVVAGRRVCEKKNDKPSKSKQNKKGHMDMECCLDPDEIPNPNCYYPSEKYGKYLK